MTAALIVSLAVLTALYVVGVDWLTRGVRNTMSLSGTSDDLPGVSVIIAARNEESGIGRCLDAVLASDYPHFEVIVVDDASNDGTANVVKGIAESSRSVVRLVSQLPGTDASGKVAAIVRGVAACNGDVIVTLDADCIVGPAWLSSMLSYMTKDVGFVAGPVAYESSRSIARRIEALEFMSLIGVGAGAIGKGKPLICNSANAAYRRPLFDEMMAHLPPRDLASADELLMNYVHERTRYSVAFCSARDALVTTQGTESLGHFVRQRMRWVGIVPHLPPVHALALAAAYIFFLAIVAFLVAGLANPVLAVAGGGALFAKSLVDARLAWSICRPFNMDGLLAVLPLAELAHLPYVLLTAPAGILRPTKWKGRVPVRASRTSIPASMEA